MPRPPRSLPAPQPDEAPAPAKVRSRAVKPAGQYHHGDLRQALIDWGTHHLDTDGADAMSLRAAAKSAGVSPAAPSRHFGDKNGLLAAIAAQGFRDLLKLRTARLDAAPGSDASARLHAVMSAYLDFATAHPARFQLMFGTRIARADYPELLQAAEASFDLLRSVVEPLVQSPRADGLSSDELAFAVWASTHGLAMLRMGQQRLPIRVRDSEHLTRLLVGFVLSALGGSPP